MSELIKSGACARGPRSAFAALLPALLLGPAAASPAHAEKLVVVEARGVGETAGETIDSSTRLTLRLGEHLTLIGQNGNQYCLDGPYVGPAERPWRTLRTAGWFSGLFGGQSRKDTDPLTDCLK